MTTRDHQEIPDSGSDSPDEWDMASSARRMANDEARRLKRKVRSKRQRNQSPGWDSSGQPHTPASPDDVSLDQKLLEVEKRFKSQEAKPHRRSKSRKKASAYAAYARKAGAVTLSLAGVFLLAYMVIVAIRPPSPPSLNGSATPEKLRVLPSLMPADPSAAAPAMPTNYSIVSSDEPRFDPVKKTITDFLTATTIESRLPLVRPTSDVRSHLEASEKHPMLTLGLVPTFGSAFILSGNFVYAEIVEAGIGVRGIILEDTIDGFRIDFDSFIGYSEADWKAIANLQIDAPVTTRALIKIIPGGNSPVPGTELAYVTDPGQNISFPAVVALLDITDEHVLGTLSTGQLLPFVITLSRAEHEGSPVLMMDDILYSGWFEQNLFR